jgi:hypothetical protein
METIITHGGTGLTFAETGEAITSLIRDLIDQAQKDFVVDRRRERRCPLLTPVTVLPVGRLAAAFAAVTHDISTRGISLLHTGPVDDHYLYLQFPESPQGSLTVVMEVLRRRKIGPLWEIAGNFRVKRKPA